MHLKHVVPDAGKTFGNLEFAGVGDVTKQRMNGRQAVVSRTYDLFSDVQRADNISVVLPAKAGEKTFVFEDKVKLVSPRIMAEPKKAGDVGYTNYIMYADDLIKA